MSYPLGSIDPDERAGPALRDGYMPDGRARRLLRGLLSSALVLLVMAAFAGGVWFAHVTGKRHGTSDDVPLLRADRHPFKIRPAAPGGMTVPDQDMLVYGERHEVVEHLLPPPETPMPRPAAAPKPAAPKPAPSQASPIAPATPPAASVPATAPAPAAAEARDHTAMLPPAPAAGSAAAAIPSAVVSPPALAKPGSGGVRLQLGAVKSPDTARREWQRLKQANADLLGDVPGFAIPADLGGKGIYYRIETAPFADRSAAERICGILKQRGSECALGR